MAIWIAILHDGMPLSITLATARDETDLDQLTARLVEVVQETMQPESVGLWLKPTADRRRTTAASGQPSGVESQGEPLEHHPRSLP